MMDGVQGEKSRIEWSRVAAGDSIRLFEGAETTSAAVVFQIMLAQ
jgi:hypothetical protein